MNRMDVRPKEDFLDRWKKYFGRAELPITCWYTDDEGSTDRAEPAKGHRCFLAELAKTRKGERLRFDIDTISCSGGKRYLGFTQDVRPNFEHYKILGGGLAAHGVGDNHASSDTNWTSPSMHKKRIPSSARSRWKQSFVV